MSLQSYVMVVTVLEVACFDFAGFTVFSFSASMVISLSASFPSSDSLVFPPSFALSVMKRAKIFRILPASNSLWRIAASVGNGGRRTALCGVQSL